jgi:hypothetical protein
VGERLIASYETVVQRAANANRAVLNEILENTRAR